MKKTIEEIKLIIEEIADIQVENINSESAIIDDLGLASYEIMAVISDVENKYNIKISEEEMLGITTINDLVKMIESKVG